MNIHDGTPGVAWGALSSVVLKTFLVIQVATFPEDTVNQVLNTGVTASIGGTVGFFVHLFWKTVVDRIKNTKEKTDENDS